jgi:very-short-patch-repair endonuclease
VNPDDCALWYTMGYQTAQPLGSEAWALAERQHGVVTRRQLLELGYSARAIKHRVEKGRLHPLWRGVYAVGRPRVGRHGTWMAAVLACGPEAVLSHESAAALWEIRSIQRGRIEVSVPATLSARGRPGIDVHRSRRLSEDHVTRHQAIPVTSPARTLLDISPRLDRDQLEAAINEADKRDLIDPEALRAALPSFAGEPGVAILRATLDRRTFTLTDSELERRFLSLARRAGLPRPETQQRVNGFRVDFYWPDLGLVVETDGLRYHRTAAQQAKDRLRDQTHMAAGLTPLRFTRAQVKYEPDHVRHTLIAVVERLRAVGQPGLANRPTG